MVETDQRAADILLPPLPARVHFVGVGGIGMSGLARILNAWGYEVSGSDSSPSPLLDALGLEGIDVSVGHTATDRAAAADLVVATAAVRLDNPELVAAHAAGRQVIKRARLLGALADARRGVAVAGSHGKSTTSGMLVHALRALGADPTYAIGAVLEGPTGVTNAAPGSGAEMVVEADEYDWSFLQLHPDMAIITNIDFDHPDLFPDAETYDRAFSDFVRGMRRDGTLVIATDDPGCQRLLMRPDFSPPANLVTFAETGNADWKLDETDEGWRVIGRDDVSVPLVLAVPGRHNKRNATAALAVLVALGYDAATAAAALEGFGGVGRRFELKGEARGVVVIDDYAHHPTEIAVNVLAAKEQFPDRQLWAVFQPHTYSRLKALLPEFAAAFYGADRVLILDVYAARETDSLGVSSADLVALLPEGALRATDPTDAARVLAKAVNEGDVVLTLGAGSITDAGPILLELLRSANVEERVAAPRVDRRGRRQRAAGDAVLVPDAPHLKAMRDAPMRLHTTWRIGGPADLLVRTATPDDVVAAVAWGRAQGLPVTIIGGGSNLLVGDRGIRGLTVLVRTPGERAADLVSVTDLGDAVRMRVGAPAPLSWTGRYAAERGWSGMDWGVGLPGTIGGATVNNAGAHGTEMKDHLERVVLLTADGDIIERPGAWLEAAYRHTIVKASPRPRPWTVLAVDLLLPKGDPDELVRLADEHAAFRKATQPTGACAGSTFANPPGDFAGRVLEECGLKGFRVGGVQFSPKHANWIVNDGTATAADVRELIAKAEERVRDRTGIVLKREVEFIGDA